MGGGKTSNRICSVPKCSSRCTKDISIHLFPKDVKLQARWKLALGINKPVTKYMQACSLHFKKTDYFFPGLSRRRILKKGTVPSQNLPSTPLNKVKRRNINETGSSRVEQKHMVNLLKANKKCKEKIDNIISTLKDEYVVDQETTQSIVKIDETIAPETMECVVKYEDMDGVETTAPVVKDECIDYIETIPCTVKEEPIDDLETIVKIEHEVGQEEAASIVKYEDVFGPRSSAFHELNINPELHQCSLTEEKGIQVTPSIINEYRRFTLCDMMKSPRDLRAFTGLSSMESVDEIVAVAANIFNKQESKSYILSLKERIIFTFVKLKTKLSFLCLSVLFGVTPGTCQNYYESTLHLLHDILKSGYSKNLDCLKIFLDFTAIGPEKKKKKDAA